MEDANIPGAIISGSSAALQCHGIGFRRAAVANREAGIINLPAPVVGNRLGGKIYHFPVSSTLGHFTSDGREFVITDPTTPRPWHNYLCSADYLVNLTQLGTGSSCGLFPSHTHPAGRAGSAPFPTSRCTSSGANTLMAFVAVVGHYENANDGS